MEPKYIIIEGIQHRVGSKSLKLCGKNINSITDIQGLDHLWRVRKLDLSHNQITTMKGIEYFPNLRILKLSDNKIQKIENVKNFQKLKKIYLDNNQLKEFKAADFPNTLIHINIAKNPIEKFYIYTKRTYKKIHFGPKQWFPEQEIKQLKRCMSYKSYEVSGYKMIGIGFLLAIVFMLSIPGILVYRGILDASWYGTIILLIFGGLIFGTLFVLCFAWDEDDVMAGWAYLCIVILFGIIGIITALAVPLEAIE